MAEWKYHVETIANNSVADLRNRLRDLGSDGWELVVVLGGAGMGDLLIVLKQPDDD